MYGTVLATTPVYYTEVICKNSLECVDGLEWVEGLYHQIKTKSLIGKLNSCSENYSSVSVS